MFKFHDFMNTLRNLAKFVFARIFAKFKYLAKQFIVRKLRSEKIPKFGSQNISSFAIKKP